MARLFQVQREAKARRDYDAVLETFTEDCYLETVPLGLRGGARRPPGRPRRLLQRLPDLAPDDEGSRLATA